MNTASSRKSLFVNCCGFLLASILLGTAYNRLSPLGIRGGSLSSISRGVAASVPVTYENTTLRLDIKPLRAAGVSAVIGGVSGESPVTSSKSSPVGRARESSAGSSARTNHLAARGSAQAPAVPKVHFFPTVRWTEVKRDVESGGAILVDTRMPKYFEAGAIPGAVPLYSGAPLEEISAFASKYPVKTPLVLYCYGPDCMIADHFAERLKNEFKYSNLRILAGGYEEYRIANLKQAGRKFP